jgi:hypothetical protein
MENGEGICAGSIEKGLPLTFASTEEEVGDDTQACEGVALCQRTLEGDHLHAAQCLYVFWFDDAESVFLCALAVEVREEAGSLTSVVAGVDQLPNDRVEGIACVKVLGTKYMLHVVVKGSVLASVQLRQGVLIDRRVEGQQVGRRDGIHVFFFVDGSTIPS